MAALIAVVYIVAMTPLLGKKRGYTVDATPSFQLTQAMVSEGALFPDARVKQGWFYSIVYLPFYGLGSLLHATLFQDQPLDWVQRKCMCWMNIVFAALTLAFITRTIERLGYSRTAQAGAALLYGFTTLGFTYARYDYNKTLAGLCLIAGLYFWLRYDQDEREANQTKHNALWSGLCYIGLLLVRAEMLVLAPVWVFAFYRPKQGMAKQGSVFTLSACIFSALAFIWFYNWLYWSGEASGGYEGSFVLNPLPAFLGFLGSPGKSLFVFNPPFLLLPLLVRHFVSRNKDAARVWCALAMTVFLLYSFWGNWWGGWGYGPRHLVPLLPLLALPLAEAIDMRSIGVYVALGVVAAAGVGVQLVGALVDFNDVILFLTNQGITEQQLIWQPLVNPIYYHIQLAFAVGPSRWDIGWAWLYSQLSFPVFLVLFSIWAAGLGALSNVITRHCK